MPQRADKALADRKLARSRSEAADLIKQGKVCIDGKTFTKPSTLVDESAVLSVSEDERYVSRGGVKLAGALRAFGIDPSGHIAVDIGSSTGGFTDCLLRHGASKVYAIDVGKDQLAPELQSDPRINLMEGTDIRTASLPELCDLAVIDVSFISLTRVLPAVAGLVRPGGSVIALIKPQFEVGKENIGKGVVKDESLFDKVIDDVKKSEKGAGLFSQEVIASPILGGDGNREFLILFKKHEV